MAKDAATKPKAAPKKEPAAKKEKKGEFFATHSRGAQTLQGLRAKKKRSDLFNLFTSAHIKRAPRAPCPRLLINIEPCAQNARACAFLFLYSGAPSRTH
jgi:hypothetical protein